MPGSVAASCSSRQCLSRQQGACERCSFFVFHTLFAQVRGGCPSHLQEYMRIVRVRHAARSIELVRVRAAIPAQITKQDVESYLTAVCTPNSDQLVCRDFARGNEM